MFEYTKKLVEDVISNRMWHNLWITHFYIKFGRVRSVKRKKHLRSYKKPHHFTQQLQPTPYFIPREHKKKWRMKEEKQKKIPECNKKLYKFTSRGKEKERE